MDSQSPTTQLVALINRRFAERTELLRAAVQDALGKLAGSPLLRADEVEAQLPPPPAAASADTTALRRWVAAIDDDRNQVNILKSLVQGAREYAPRVALFVVRGDGVAGWAAAGFTGNGSASDDKVKSVSLPLSADTVIGRVAQSATPFVGPPHQQRQNDTLFEAIGGLDPVEVAAFPVANKGRVAAVLYADSGSLPSGLTSADALEILSRTASMSIELIPVRGKAPQQPAAAPVAAPTAAPVATPAAARPAAPAAAAPAPSPAAARPAALDTSRLPPEEQKLHEAAKRFARLLVSEIKLYNEAKVVEGRKSRDLYNRLKEDIDRSRAMYNQRVNPKIAQTTNYFYDELVHALGEGDSGVLAGYPT